VEALLRIEQVIREEDKQELDPYSKRLWRSLRQEKNPPSELIAAAQHAIVQINEAEDRLVRVVESGQKALLEHAEQGLIDWSMPFDYEFFLLLDPGETRPFYETCADGEEPLRIYLPRYLYSPDKPTRRGKYNWNFFENCEEHPLRAEHHGYLVHHILEHAELPWQLLPYIKEIEINLKFTDFEAAWERSGNSS
jgi:hypothetical protein